MASTLAAPAGVDHRVLVAAPRARVWRALVDPADLRRWLFESAHVDPRVGGEWRFTFPHWPSARGLWHPSLDMGGPILVLEPERRLDVRFAEPYFGVVCFTLADADGGTLLRVTHDGFAGNEEWLADFSGGWRSFADRLAVLCELEAQAAPRALAPLVGRVVHADPEEAPRLVADAARRAALAGGEAPWISAGPPLATAGRVAIVLPEPGGATLSPACNALCTTLPPGFPPDRLAAAEASLGRSLRRRGWIEDGASRIAFGPVDGPVIELCAPYRPACDLADPAPFVRAFERAFCAAERTAAPAYFAGEPAFALAGGPYPRPVPVALRRLPERAVVRFELGPLDADGVLRCAWTGAGWTAGRNAGSSEWTFAADGRIERLELRFAPPRATARGA